MKLLKRMYCNRRTVNKFNRLTLIRLRTLIKREKMILAVTDIISTLFGRVDEWFKSHAWKACLGEYPNAGSNPAPSAIVPLLEFFYLASISINFITSVLRN